MTRLISRKRLPPMSSYLASSTPTERPDLLAATHPSDHNSVYGLYRGYMAEAARRHRLESIAKNKWRVTKKEKKKEKSPPNPQVSVINGEYANGDGRRPQRGYDELNFDYSSELGGFFGGGTHDEAFLTPVPMDCHVQSGICTAATASVVTGAHGSCASAGAVRLLSISILSL